MRAEASIDRAPRVVWPPLQGGKPAASSGWFTCRLLRVGCYAGRDICSRIRTTSEIDRQHGRLVRRKRVCVLFPVPWFVIDGVSEDDSAFTLTEQEPLDRSTLTPESSTSDLSTPNAWIRPPLTIFGQSLDFSIRIDGFGSPALEGSEHVGLLESFDTGDVVGM